MSFINHHAQEITSKILYYGPGMGGKTTNIQYLYYKSSGQLNHDLVAMEMDNERTLFFDFVPFHAGELGAFKLKFHLYSVPGQAFYEASRRLILRGSDGIIFVVDSQINRMDANKESWKELLTDLDAVGMDISQIPLIFQWNKRDCPNIVATSILEETFNPNRFSSFESVARQGIGVLETIDCLIEKILKNLQKNFSSQTNQPSLKI